MATNPRGGTEAVAAPKSMTPGTSRGDSVPGSVHIMARRAAATTCSMLITGETGVGKGRFAQWVHRHSPRADGPFVPVNCGAIPESIIDSQLFGHARGSFSGADSEHAGLVRAATGGTLFLDEVGELPASAQRRLLRLLQEREVQPVGYTRPVNVDVRIIAATNGPLVELVHAGAFRADLFYRLDVIRIDLPALRDRRDEVAALVDELNHELSSMYGGAPLQLTRGALRVLEHHDWPGNVRQLRTVLERLHVLCDDHQVTADALFEYGQLDRPVPGSVSTGEHLMKSARDKAVHDALAAAGGCVSKAAAALGVHRSTIYRWLARAGAA